MSNCSVFKNREIVSDRWIDGLGEVSIGIGWTLGNVAVFGEDFVSLEGKVNGPKGDPMASICCSFSHMWPLFGFLQSLHL
mmetsp:Transcript_88094/g.132017  ORF Transcript_88094/g.132017 Transcript_88094/m.132017 type:complete len:80 (+) Transcript_88094:230-469(+)